MVKSINIGLIFKIKRVLEKSIKEKKTKIKLNIIKAICHSVENIVFDIATKTTGSVYI